MSDPKTESKSRPGLVGPVKWLVRLPCRIWYGVKIGVWVILHPDPMTGTLFTMLNDLLALIMKVATEDRHFMTEIMITVNKDVPQPLVHIWAGAGASADPLRRIKELLEENEALREQLKSA